MAIIKPPELIASIYEFSIFQTSFIFVLFYEPSLSVISDFIQLFRSISGQRKFSIIIHTEILKFMIISIMIRIKGPPADCRNNIRLLKYSQNINNYKNCDFQKVKCCLRAIISFPRIQLNLNTNQF